MHPFHIDSRWFETYWYGNQPFPTRRSLSRRLNRLAICILIIVGGAAVIVDQAEVRVGSHRPDHVRIRFM
jgi:hypothetical protein